MLSSYCSPLPIFTWLLMPSTTPIRVLLIGKIFPRHNCLNITTSIISLIYTQAPLGCALCRGQPDPTSKFLVPPPRASTFPFLFSITNTAHPDVHSKCGNCIGHLTASAQTDRFAFQGVDLPERARVCYTAGLLLLFINVSPVFWFYLIGTMRRRSQSLEHSSQQPILIFTSTPFDDPRK